MKLDERGLLLARVIFVFLGVLPVGCNSSSVEVYPATGEVFFDGKPANGAVVHFHPADQVKCPAAFATVQDDGSFQVATFAAHDGAAVGEYAVTVNWRDATVVEGETQFGPDRLGDRYSNPVKSQLNATITKSKNVIPRYDLKK